MLAKDDFSPANYPTCDNTAFDGYAVNSRETIGLRKKKKKKFKILRAIAAGDIGEHFPCNDTSLAGIDSAELLDRVLQLADSQQFRLINVDITIIAQVPKLSPYRQELTASLCSLLCLDSDRVNLKASTTERLGYIGREEGIACHAVVLMHTNA